MRSKAHIAGKKTIPLRAEGAADAGIAARLDGIRRHMRAEYRKRHADPWIIAYSGGKDSTLLLQLVWETVAALPADERRRPLYIVANDTLVESPVVIAHLKKSLEKIKQAAEAAAMPVQTRMTQPCIDQTFWVNVIGRGYIPPTRNFRWCTDRMKIKPTDRVIKRLTARGGRAVLLIGTRRSESANRRRGMEKRGVKADKMNAHGAIAGCRMFAPLADLADDDVWMVLMQRRPPWGGTHRNLITLYRNAGGGECPLILTKDDAPSCGTTSPRFGCWTCTVVKRDGGMRGVMEPEEIFDFREWLIQLRENEKNRMEVCHDGRIRKRKDGGLVRGPFTLKIRKKILKRLRALEAKTGETLLSQGEKEMIEDIWWREELIEEARASLYRRLGFSC